MGRGSWRIYDGTRARSLAARLIAHVDRTEVGSLDVLWVRSPCPTRSRYRDMDELLGDLSAAVEAAEVPRTGRPRQIPHFPPV